MGPASAGQLRDGDVPGERRTTNRTATRASDSSRRERGPPGESSCPTEQLLSKADLLGASPPSSSRRRSSHLEAPAPSASGCSPLALVAIRVAWGWPVGPGSLGNLR